VPSDLDQSPSTPCELKGSEKILQGASVDIKTGRPIKDLLDSKEREAGREDNGAASLDPETGEAQLRGNQKDAGEAKEQVGRRKRGSLKIEPEKVQSKPPNPRPHKQNHQQPLNC